MKRFEATDFFHHIAIYTSNYDKTVEFYEALGFVKYLDWVEDGQPCCFLNMHNGPFLEFHGVKDAQPLNEDMHICIHTDNVDEFYACAVENGAEPWKFTPRNYPLRCSNGNIIDARIAFVKAPAGEKIEIISWRDYRKDDFQNFFGTNKSE